jgi:hypothetical protein
MRRWSTPTTRATLRTERHRRNAPRGRYMPLHQGGLVGHCIASPWWSAAWWTPPSQNRRRNSTKPEPPPQLHQAGTAAATPPSQNRRRNSTKPEPPPQLHQAALVAASRRGGDLLLGPTTASATEETETPQKEQADQPAGAGGPLALDGPAGAGGEPGGDARRSSRRDAPATLTRSF